MKKKVRKLWLNIICWNDAFINYFFIPLVILSITFIYTNSYIIEKLGKYPEKKIVIPIDIYKPNLLFFEDLLRIFKKSKRWDDFKTEFQNLKLTVKKYPFIKKEKIQKIIDKIEEIFVCLKSDNDSLEPIIANLKNIETDLTEKYIYDIHASLIIQNGMQEKLNLLWNLYFPFEIRRKIITTFSNDEKSVPTLKKSLFFLYVDEILNNFKIAPMYKKLIYKNKNDFKEIIEKVKNIFVSNQNLDRKMENIQIISTRPFPTLLTKALWNRYEIELNFSA